MKQRFLLLSTQRSGSTYVRLWLNNHPDIRCHSEVFLKGYEDPDGFSAFCSSQPLYRFAYWWARRAGLYRRNPSLWRGTRHLACILITRYLTSLFEDPHHPGPWSSIKDRRCAPAQSPKSTVGFKLMYDQLETFDFLDSWIRGEEVKIIHLVREDALRIALSRFVAETTRIYHTTSKLNQDPIYVDPESLIERMRKILASQESIRTRYQLLDYLETSYETFFGKDGSAKERILKFLGVAEAKIEEPPLKKATAERISEIVSNFAEISEALGRAGFASFLPSECSP